MSITVIPYNYFTQQKAAAISTPLDVLKSKYTLLYNSYMCFSPTHVAYVKPKKVFTDFRKLNQNRKDPKKAIIHILNVINKSNYDKLFNKLKILIDDTNIILIITEILARACLQIFYVDTYIKIITDLLVILKPTQQKVLRSALADFANSFTSNQEYHIRIENEPNSYNAFCKIQKLKSFILAKNIFILELHINNLITSSFELEAYVVFFKDKLNAIEHTYDNELYIDIILQILLYISKKFPDIHMDIDIDKIMRISTNQKIKFMLHDLVRPSTMST